MNPPLHVLEKETEFEVLFCSESSCVSVSMTSLSLSWLSQGKGKEDRQVTPHRFVAGSCLGPAVCLVCDKPASGRDLLHCPGE